MRPSLKRCSWDLSCRSESLRATSACVTPARTSERDWAWVTSGSTSARTSPALTTAPSRTFSDTTRPETADFTSTFVSGSTTPTSRTLTWRSSACTLPRRKGGLSASLDFSLPRDAKTTPPPARTTIPAAERIHLIFLDMRDLDSHIRKAAPEVRGRDHVPDRYCPGKGIDVPCCPVLSIDGYKRLMSPQGQPGDILTIKQLSEYLMVSEK